MQEESLAQRELQDFLAVTRDPQRKELVGSTSTPCSREESMVGTHPPNTGATGQAGSGLTLVPED